LRVLKLIEEHQKVPKTYFKLLVNTDGIWEVRVQLGNSIFRILGFFENGNLVLLTNGFIKKTQKTPRGEIKLAQKRRAEWLGRK
jgi:phage-related protein